MAQCPTGDVVLATQAQVDAFGLQYPNCSTLENLLIGNEDITLESDITSLRSLSSLQTITGNLDIIDVDQLLHLTGLNNLTSVIGTFGIGSNSALIDFSGMEKLSSRRQGV
ncbi:hypothetical protein IC229_23155 [Spirosoma sp. BT702]|uniref:Receptor L-domain domain-containing protein n=1 Tax=Spirosoma profusum TaxID=2771354 RepID=A0A926Y0B7_9BACT|nr:hypothetical protein [Spirosoma profusum]MBD2703561.1 hypothetical protein [Spirosoma profusum]